MIINTNIAASRLCEIWQQSVLSDIETGTIFLLYEVHSRQYCTVLHCPMWHHYHEMAFYGTWNSTLGRDLPYYRHNRTEENTSSNLFSCTINTFYAWVMCISIHMQWTTRGIMFPIFSWSHTDMNNSHSQAHGIGKNQIVYNFCKHLSI